MQVFHSHSPFTACYLTSANQSRPRSRLGVAAIAGACGGTRVTRRVGWAGRTRRCQCGAVRVVGAFCQASGSKLASTFTSRQPKQTKKSVGTIDGALRTDAGRASGTVETGRAACNDSAARVVCTLPGAVTERLFGDSHSVWCAARRKNQSYQCTPANCRSPSPRNQGCNCTLMLPQS